VYQNLPVCLATILESVPVGSQELERVSVFLVAANRLLREALARVLRTKGDVHVVEACAPDGSLGARIITSSPDVLLLEGQTSPRSDLVIIRELLAQQPDLRVILIGMTGHERTFLEAVRAGVCGYVLQDASAMDIVSAVRAVSQGEAVCPPQLCLSLFRHFARDTGRIPAVRMRMDLGLTRREQQLLPLIAQGLTNKEIASQLHLSEQTIKNHIHRMLQRLGASHRLEAVELVRVQGVYID
jgi:two-component system, NarL family, response regulator DevR